MDADALVNEILASREWHASELAIYKSIPLRYANQLFSSVEETYWRMCVPMVYSHWEGFIMEALRGLCEYINSLQINYTDIVDSIALLANRPKFGYLQGNCTHEQQARFYSEFITAYSGSVNIEYYKCISCKSNLNFDQLSRLLSEFGMIPTDKILREKGNIEKLVTYRNKIAHGENSICVQRNEIEQFCTCIVSLCDEFVIMIKLYIQNMQYLSCKQQ